MEIMVLGSNGQLGRSIRDVFKNELFDITFFSKSDLNITDKLKLEDALKTYNPKIIINAAAYTQVDMAEDDSLNAYSINSSAPKYLSEICKSKDIHLIHISTDYVFDGVKNSGYIEEDVTNPLCIYGKSKLCGEENIIKSGCSYSIIRTAWVFSEYGNNFVKTMISLANKNEISVVSDQIGTPTYAGDIAKLILKICSLKEFSNIRGIFHFSGNKKISWFEFSNFIFKSALEVGVIKSKPNLYPILSKDYITKARRPNNSVLNSSKICSLFKTEPSDWQAGVRIVLNKI